MSFYSELSKQIKNEGGTQQTIEVKFEREKLTLEQYRSNWKNFILDAVDYAGLSEKEKKEYKSNYSNEKRSLIRLHSTGEYRIKIIRSGIVVALDGHKDILVSSLEGAIKTSNMIANAFDNGGLDTEVKEWMAKKDENSARVKKMKKMDFSGRTGLPTRKK
jgi:hypothetical protein